MDGTIKTASNKIRSGADYTPIRTILPEISFIFLHHQQILHIRIMSKVLIVSNCPSKNTRKLQNAVVKGCKCDELEDTTVRALIPWNADADSVLWCDGIILGTTENFGTMSGAVKDFLERIYYPCLELTEGKPVALFVKGGLDGQGAKTSVERILVGLKWKLIQPPLVMKGEFQHSFLNQCETLGTTMSAGLEAGIY